MQITDIKNGNILEREKIKVYILSLIEKGLEGYSPPNTYTEEQLHNQALEYFDLFCRIFAKEKITEDEKFDIIENEYSSYKKIKLFCDDKNSSKFEEAFLIQGYFKKYCSKINVFKYEENKTDMVEILKNVFVDDDTLNRELNEAKQEWNKAKQEIEQICKQECEQNFDKELKYFKRKNFWGAVVASMLASVIFTIILAFAFRFGHDLIFNWLNGFLFNGQSIPPT